MDPFRVTLYPNGKNYYPPVDEKLPFYPVDLVKPMGYMHGVMPCNAVTIVNPEMFVRNIIPSRDITVTVPVNDPFTGAPGYMAGPPINLNPRNTSPLMERWNQIQIKENQPYGADIPLIATTSPYGPPPVLLTNANINDSLAVERRSLNQIYTGAGILVFLNINNGYRNELAVMLFENSQTGQFEELGGEVGFGEADISAVARREANEESAKLFNFTSFPAYVDLKHNTNAYRCFSVMIEPTIQLIPTYINNLSKLPAGPATAVYNETKGANFFYVSDLNNALNASVPGYGITCTDVSGNVKNIRSRTKAALNATLKGVTNIISIIQASKKTGSQPVYNPDGTVTINF